MDDGNGRNTNSVILNGIIDVNRQIGVLLGQIESLRADINRTQQEANRQRDELSARIDKLAALIELLDRREILTEGEADFLRNTSRENDRAKAAGQQILTGRLIQRPGHVIATIAASISLITLFLVYILPHLH